MNNQRRHIRLSHRAKIKLIVPGFSKAYILDMRDFSESGLFLLAPQEAIPAMNSIVEVQTTEFEDAPLQAGRVVRLEEGVGFAVEFMPESPDINV